MFELAAIGLVCLIGVGAVHLIAHLINMTDEYFDQFDQD